jgi:hypothetical protein
MNLFDAINSHRYLYLLELGEPEDNVLRLIVAEGRTLTPDKPSGNLTISTAAPIVADEQSAKYELLFESYVAYSVRNESFTVVDNEERFEGGLFRIYTASPFLQYVGAATIASDDFGGPYQHYGLLCLNHIVDIASAEKPRVRVLQRETELSQAVDRVIVKNAELYRRLS